jgi:hypothetical protein
MARMSDAQWFWAVKRAQQAAAKAKAVQAAKASK